jgi:ubiquinone/menaquinone biosynthesis C-methylase UbiE
MNNHNSIVKDNDEINTEINTEIDKETSIFKTLILEKNKISNIFHKNTLKFIGKYSSSGDVTQALHNNFHSKNNKIIEKIVEKSGENDVEIIKELYKMRPILTKKLNKNDNKNRSLGRANDIIDVLKAAGMLDIIKKYHSSGRILNILDIGCADASIIISLRSALNKILSEEDNNSLSSASTNIIKLHGTDIYDPKISSAAGVNFKLNDEKSLPFEKNSMDIVLCLMTMHHFRHLNEMLAAINKVLNSTGIFIFREHDLPADPIYKPLEWKFLEMVHIMEECIFHPLPGDKIIETFLSSHFSNYKSAAEWKKIIEEKIANSKIIYFNDFSNLIPKNIKNISVETLLTYNPQRVYWSAALKKG